MFMAFPALSQNVQIHGRAHSTYGGKIIELQTVVDFITNSRQKESVDTIHSDGSFELLMQCNFVQPVYFKIGNVVAILYVQPDYVYEITIPEIDEDKRKNDYAELSVNLGVVGADSTELNSRIFDYQALYTQLFLNSDNRYLSRAILFQRADSLQKLCKERYKGNTNTYFTNYVNYSIASINTSLSRGEEYLMKSYLVGKPVQYGHHEYMQFFNDATRGYLERMSAQRKGQTIYNIINTKASYAALLAFVEIDLRPIGDSLRELIIIKNLWDFYFKPDFSAEAIKLIVAQINQQTANAEHRKITSHMLAHFNNMQIGSKAPNFKAMGRDGKAVELSAFKGRWVYLNFFSTKNTESLKEMPKISALRKKYGDKLMFLSICVDDSLLAYKNYLKANPKFDWPIWYNYGYQTSKTAREAYAVIGTEAYFLINNLGDLAQSPALSPSKGLEYKLNVLFKVRERKTKTGIR